MTISLHHSDLHVVEPVTVKRREMTAIDDEGVAFRGLPPVHLQVRNTSITAQSWCRHHESVPQHSLALANPVLEYRQSPDKTDLQSRQRLHSRECNLLSCLSLPWYPALGGMRSSSVKCERAENPGNAS